MSTTTDNLGMFLYVPASDGAQTFNIDRCISDNFKLLDKMLNIYSYDSTFTYSSGMFVMDDGIIYRSLTDNNVGKALTNTTYWEKVLFDNTTNLMNILRPIGQPIMRLDDTIFDDERRLEGAEVSRETYSSLFAIYGTTYGVGDGSTTFNLPDYRGRVAWGTSAGSFGYINAGLPNITGRWTVSGADGNNPSLRGAFYRYGTHTSAGKGHNSGQSQPTIGFDASLPSATNINANGIYRDDCYTVQPPAIRVRFVTRYK